MTQTMPALVGGVSPDSAVRDVHVSAPGPGSLSETPVGALLLVTLHLIPGMREKVVNGRTPALRRSALVIKRLRLRQLAEQNRRPRALVRTVTSSRMTSAR